MDSAEPANVHVLLAEDNRADVHLVKDAIETHRLPVTLHIVDDGEKAIEFIERAERDADAPSLGLLLLDLNLPKRSGFDVLQRIRQSAKFGSIPVLITTSSDSPRDRAETARLGANGYFRKPASYDQFLTLGEVINEMLRTHRMRTS